MAIEEVEYKRKTFTVIPVRVTAENQREVAAWCGGSVRSKFEYRDGKPFILVPVYGVVRSWENVAFVGDWVVRSSKGFKVYPDKSFKALFERPDDLEEKRSRILDLVEETMGGNTWGMTESDKVIEARDIADKIMKEFS